MLALTGILTLGLALASSATAGGEKKFYQQHNLVSDIDGLADHFDANLANPWGLAFGPASFPTPFWVADNHTDVSTIYDGTGQAFPLVVAVPGGPTGVVFNGTSDFLAAPSFPSLFIFATEAGTIAAWNLFVPVFPSDTTVVKQTVPDANYKG